MSFEDSGHTHVVVCKLSQSTMRDGAMIKLAESGDTNTKLHAHDGAGSIVMASHEQIEEEVIMTTTATTTTTTTTTAATAKNIASSLANHKPQYQRRRHCR